MAMVVGPTPPTRGVIAPATSSQRLVDVGEQASALVAHAAADHDRAGRDVLGLEDAGHAGGGDDDAGAARVLGPVGHAGVHDGDRGVGGRALLREQQRERATERGAAAEDADLVTGDGDLVEREQRLDAGRGARAPGPASSARGDPC